MNKKDLEEYVDNAVADLVAFFTAMVDSCENGVDLNLTNVTLNNFCEEFKKIISERVDERRKKLYETN